MGHLKRRRPAHLLRPDQMLSTLSSLRLHALLQHGGLWLAVPPELAEVLNQCCTGQMEGGPDTAEEVAAVLAPLVGEPELPAGIHAAAAASGAAPAAPAARGASEALPTPAPAPSQQQQQQETEPDSSVQDAMQEDGVTEPQAQRVAGPMDCEPGEPGPGFGEGAGGALGTASPAAGERTSGGAAACGGEAEGRGAEASGMEQAGGPDAGAGAAGPAGGVVARTAAEVEEHVASWQPWAEGRGGGGQGGGGRGGGRGRGRRGPPPPPYSPAAAGCRLVAVRLTLEESFFLHFVLRCLQVYELQPGSPIPATADHVRLLDSEGLWRACRGIRSNFVTSYVAYHHLKAKGWIPRSGLLYGVDYVVYQLHPVGAHSDFGVLVVPLAGDGTPTLPHSPPLGWLDLQITNRLVNQVVKKLILLYLCERPGPDHSSPACLENFAVEERIVRRWVPDATRD